MLWLDYEMEIWKAATEFFVTWRILVWAAISLGGFFADG